MKGQQIIVTDEAVGLARELVKARAEAKEAGERAEEIRQELLRILPREGKALNAVTAAGEAVYSVNRVSTRRVNSKKLEAKYPDVYADVVTDSEQERLTVDLDE